MALTQRGLFQVYNRLPVPHEFQWDSYVHTIPAHAIEECPSVGMVKALIVQTAFKYGPQGITISGIVAQGDPNFGKPLTAEEIWTGDPIKDNQIPFARPQELEVRPVELEARDLPQMRKSIDPDVTVRVGRR